MSSSGPSNRVCRFFEEHLGRPLDRENDAIADAVFELFPGQLSRLRWVEGRLNRLPGPPPTPKALVELGKALEDCRRDRQVLPTVQAVVRHLDRLRDGVQQLGILHAELRDDAIQQVATLHRAVIFPLQQLRAIDALDAALRPAAERLEEQLASPFPWRGAAALLPDAAAVSDACQAARARQLQLQGDAAEHARATVRQRPGFSGLDDDQRHHVLRPITLALFDTTPDAVAPPLLTLRDDLPHRLADAVHTAQDRLDELLSAGDRPQIVKVALALSDREVGTPQELDALLDEVRGRVLAQLKAGHRVRLL